MKIEIQPGELGEVVQVTGGEKQSVTIKRRNNYSNKGLEISCDGKDFSGLVNTLKTSLDPLSITKM